jgi:HSP20 family molecular chaperone IbpA
MAETRLRKQQKPSWNMESCCIESLFNITVDTDEVMITADLPYTDADKIKISPIARRMLEIKAEMKRKVRFEEFGITHRQGEFRFFRCRVRVPVPVDFTRMKTQLKRGILEVHLPRRKAPRKILK